jgi:hypothetical protein
MKRLSKNCDISNLESIFSKACIIDDDEYENPEYLLLKQSIMAKYTNKNETIELLQSTRDRYLRYIKYINFEENWRIERHIFEFLRLDICKNTKKLFEMMKCIDNMIINIIDI